MTTNSISAAEFSLRSLRFLFLLAVLTLPLLSQAQNEGPESLSYDPNQPRNIVSKWEGPYTHNEGWTYWKANMGDGSGMWVWDNGKGERRFGYDANNDGQYESWQEELTIQGMPLYQIYHWDRNQDGTDNAIAWAEGGAWIEKVWDSNNDGLIDSWCSYKEPGCAQFIMNAQCNLGDKKSEFDKAYYNYLNAQSNGPTYQKRAYSIYQRADLVFKICKNMSR